MCYAYRRNFYLLARTMSYCSKSWTTEHCARNQSFMRKLNGMYQEYLGSLEFKCDYFTPDLDKIKEKQQCECCCCGEQKE